jgi:hypothetical protein
MIKRYLSLFLKGWKKFYENINFFVSFLLLSFVYLIGVFFSFLIVKIFKIRLFDLKNKKDSYWRSTERADNQYYKQF